MSEARGTGARTGANAEQIEAAVDRWPGYEARYRDRYRDIITGYAADLVPPGAVIAEAADVASLARVLTDARQWQANMVNADVLIASTPDDLARLEAMIVRGGTG